MRIRRLLFSFLTFFVIAIYLTQVVPLSSVMVKNLHLAQRAMSLENRYGNAYVNGVFKDNILLTMAYMRGIVKSRADIDWKEVKKPFSYELVIQPGEVFAFHDGVKSTYKNKHVVTTNAHFGAYEGFLSDGYLFGDGVCHLASLINWAARDAGLAVVSPTNHDFANIPEVPREYGVSIYTVPDQPAASAAQNLYIENTFERPVVFAFEYKNGALSLVITKPN